MCVAFFGALFLYIAEEKEEEGSFPKISNQE